MVEIPYCVQYGPEYALEPTHSPLYNASPESRVKHKVQLLHYVPEVERPFPEAGKVISAEK